MYHQGKLFVYTKLLTPTNARRLTQVANFKFLKQSGDFSIFDCSHCVFLDGYKSKIIKPKYDVFFPFYQDEPIFVRKNKK